MSGIHLSKSTIHELTMLSKAEHKDLAAGVVLAWRYTLQNDVEIQLRAYESTQYEVCVDFNHRRILREVCSEARIEYIAKGASLLFGQKTQLPQ